MSTPRMLVRGCDMAPDAQEAREFSLSSGRDCKEVNCSWPAFGDPFEKITLVVGVQIFRHPFPKTPDFARSIAPSSKVRELSARVDRTGLLVLGSQWIRTTASGHGEATM